MRKNKTFITMTLLIAVVALGIGYAAITNIELSINGSASASAADANFSVNFEGTPGISKKNGEDDLTGEQYIATASLGDANASGNILTANFTVSGFDTAGQKAIFTYDIRNNSPELNAKVDVGTITNNNKEYFNVEVTPTTANIGTGDKTVITVTVTLKKTPAEDQEPANVAVPILATPIGS